MPPGLGLSKLTWDEARQGRSSQATAVCLKLDGSRGSADSDTTSGTSHKARRLMSQ